MGINGFHHLAMEVENLDESIRFYTEILGFSKHLEFSGENRRIVLVDAGNGNFMELYEGRTKQSGDGSILHFAFRTDDCDPIVERVREYGSKITIEPKDVELQSDPVYPIRIAFFEGPDGEVIELFQER